MALNRWLAVHLKDGGKTAIKIDDIWRMNEVSSGYMKYTEIEMEGGEIIVVFGTVEEIVDKING